MPFVGETNAYAWEVYVINYITASLFLYQMEAVMFIILFFTFQLLGKMFINSLLFMVWEVYFSMFSEVIWTKVTCSLFYNNNTMLVILNLILNTEFSVLNVRFEDWGISLEVYHRISPSFSWRIFCHVMG